MSDTKKNKSNPFYKASAPKKTGPGAPKRKSARDGNKNSADNKKAFNYKDIITTAAKLMFITLAVAGILAVVNEVTKDKIPATALEAQQKALNQSLPGAVFAEISPSSDKGFGENIESVFTAEKDGVLSAYAVIVSCDGFKDAIRLLVVADAETLKIKKVTPISDSETQGIGTKVFAGKILERYEGMSGNIEFSENPAVGVQAVSGATITSKAVRDGVNDALNALSGMKGGAANER